MKQYEAVIKVMEENRGYARLGDLYQLVPRISNVEWKTKTPFASIRRIVQDEWFFFKIRPGLWALKSFRDCLPEEILIQAGTPKSKKDEYTHTYYQGLLAEIGNMKKYQTAISNQDKNKNYMGNRLQTVASLSAYYIFSYEQIVKYAKTVDVTWFNERKMPDSFFEIEHAGDIKSSLQKFVELQDFRASFYIVADKARQPEFQNKSAASIFSPISNNVKFASYEDVSNWHSSESLSYAVEKGLGRR
jgi:hypothetical protein